MKFIRTSYFLRVVLCQCGFLISKIYFFFSYICNCKVNQYSAYITYTLNTPYHKIKSLLIEVIDRKILYLDTKFWSKLRKIACKQRKWRILQLGVVKITQWMYVYGWTIQSTIPIKGKYRFNRNFWELSWPFLNCFCDFLNGSTSKFVIIH